MCIRDRPDWEWTPSIAPSGLAIYDGRQFPDWRGDLFVGALVAREVRRLEVVGDEPVAEQALFGSLDTRVRDVRNGPDGALYLLLPSRIVRVERSEAAAQSTPR